MNLRFLGLPSSLGRFTIILNPSAVDISLARELNSKILCYILWAQMSDMQLYHHHTDSFSLDEAATSSRRNFGRLFRQFDVTKILPVHKVLSHSPWSSWHHSSITTH